MRIGTFLSIVLGFLLLSACSGSGDSRTAADDSGAGPSKTESADYVFTNGNVYTVDSARPSAEAVAVRGNEIVYVGDSAGAAAFVGGGTKEVDLAGRTLMPGFVDAHNHALAGGLIARGKSLETNDMDELMDLIRAADLSLGGGRSLGLGELPRTRGGGHRRRSRRHPAPLQLVPARL